MFNSSFLLYLNAAAFTDFVGTIKLISSILYYSLTLCPDEEAEEEEAEEESEEEADEEHENTDDEGDEDNTGAIDDTDQEEGDKQDLHPHARMPTNNTVKALDAVIIKYQIKQREKMQKKYNASHKIVIFKEGEFASMVISKEDRAPGDNLRMIFKILAIPLYSRHRVQSLYGIIEGLIPTRSLNVIAEQLVPGYMEDFKNAPGKEILLSLKLLLRHLMLTMLR